MPAIRNPFDDTNFAVLAELSDYRNRAIKAKPIPLGMEKVRRSVADARIASLSMEDRQNLLAEIGPEEAAKMLAAEK